MDQTQYMQNLQQMALQQAGPQQRAYYQGFGGLGQQMAPAPPAVSAPVQEPKPDICLLLLEDE